MKITSIKCSKYEGSNNKLLGLVDLTVDDCLAMHKIRVIARNDGTRFLSFPSVKTIDQDGNVKFTNLFHPINASTREYFEKTVLEEFDKTE